jgi:hypothetical protein
MNLMSWAAKHARPYRRRRDRHERLLYGLCCQHPIDARRVTRVRSVLLTFPPLCVISGINVSAAVAIALGAATVDSAHDARARIPQPGLNAGSYTGCIFQLTLSLLLPKPLNAVEGL